MITADRARELADEIEQLALPGSSDPHPLISMVVRLLRESGNGYLVEMLAQELEGRGYVDLAGTVRAEGSTDQGDFVFVTR